MKPLSLTNYLFISFKKVIPQILMLSIKISLFLFLCSIGLAVKYGVEKDSITLLNQYASIYVKDNVNESRRQEIITELASFDGVIDHYNGSGKTEGLCKLIIFNSFCWTFEVDKNELDYVLNSIDGKIIDGNMPNNPGEMIISEQLSKSLNKNVGDYVGRDERILKGYKISGIYKSEHNVFIGYSDYKEDLDSVFYRLEPNKSDAFYKELYKYKSEVIIFTEKTEIINMLNNIFRLLNISGIIILLITAVEITISVSNLNRVYFSEKSEEFSLLRSIGYSEKFILKRLFNELLIMMSTGLIGGLFIGQVLIVLFNYLYCVNRGIPFKMFSPLLYLFSIVLIFIIYILTYFPLKKYIKSMDWIEVIQEKSS